MSNHFVNFLYFAVVLLLLLQAVRVMSQSLFTMKNLQKKNNPDDSDRTGLITVHPELLNQEGKITDEDLLTVRFSNDIEPPKSSNEDAL